MKRVKSQTVSSAVMSRMISLIIVDLVRYGQLVLAVQIMLFDPFVVICGWGRREIELARWRIIPVESQKEADELAARIVERKIRRVYWTGVNNKLPSM